MMGNIRKIMLGSHPQSATKFFNPLRKQMPEMSSGKEWIQRPLDQDCETQSKTR